MGGSRYSVLLQVVRQGCFTRPWMSLLQDWYLFQLMSAMGAAAKSTASFLFLVITLFVMSKDGDHCLSTYVNVKVIRFCMRGGEQDKEPVVVGHLTGNLGH